MGEKTNVTGYCITPSSQKLRNLTQLMRLEPILSTDPVQLLLLLVKQCWEVAFLPAAVGLANELHPTKVFRLDAALSRNSTAAFLIVVLEVAMVKDLTDLGTVLWVHSKDSLDQLNFRFV